jgi:hypothetical protein
MSHWRKSSFSNGNGGNNCVEVKRLARADIVVVRNSKSTGVEVHFTKDEWRAFLDGAKAGEFG